MQTRDLIVSFSHSRCLFVRDKMRRQIIESTVVSKNFKFDLNIVMLSQAVHYCSGGGAEVLAKLKKGVLGPL